MRFTLMPDFKFNTFCEATPDFLAGIGIKGIILDIDNTLEPYENPTPSTNVLNWILSLKAIGISAAIVSNNNKERVDLFNKDLNLPAYSKAKKPFKKNLLNAMRDMGTDASNTIMMGDQLFTDVWAARNAGIRAIAVPPIKDKRNFITRFKRILEKPIMRRFERKMKR